MADNWVLYEKTAGAEVNVTLCKGSGAWEKIAPNMIYNRLDLIREEPAELLEVHNIQGGVYYIPCCVVDNTALLGVWGTRLTMAQAQAVARYVFERHPEVVAVSSRRADLVDAPETFHRVNDFHIDLPSIPDEVDARMSAKSRATMRRKLRLAQKEYGVVSVQNISVDHPQARALFDAYFAMKRVTHDREYGMTMEEYIRTYYVTDIYVMRFGTAVAALVLLCEQGTSVYLENLTYDVAFSKYSPGGLLYHECVKRLVTKGKQRFYLKGGPLSYKRHYGSIEQWLTTFKIYRNASVVGLDTF